MPEEIFYVNEASGIPLFGIDFLGIIDRGTNVLEIKPTTLCNLMCRYCFVRSGGYKSNFIVDSEYILKKLKQVIERKRFHDIEIHFAPYGEILLYPELLSLVKKISALEGIKTISMQTNGMLLKGQTIHDLATAGITRINLSLNTLNSKKARYLSDCQGYEVDHLLNCIDLILETSMNLLIAPVWFPGENDEDIEDIIQLVIQLRERGYSENKVQIGIQKYLIYKTGRKLKKIRPKSWGYFYKQLSDLEKKHGIKLKLGPDDFGIHKRPRLLKISLKKEQLVKVTILSKGRFPNECIGRLAEDYGIKVLLNRPFTFTDELIGKTIDARVINANYKDNIITAFFPPSK